MFKGHEITRRSLLAGFGASLSVAAIGAAVVPAVMAGEACELPLDPAARFEAARAEFRAAAQALYPDIDDWNDRATENGVVMIGLCPPRPVEFDGFGVYEIQTGKITPIVALAASEYREGYYWQLCWKRVGETHYRFQGDVHFVRTSDLTIKRKIALLA